MKAEKPAQSISRVERFNDAVVYNIDCECTSTDHAVQAWIEIGHDEDLPDVEVTFYVQTDFAWYEGWWERIKLASAVLWKGYSQQEHSLILKKQGALNVAAALEQTIEDLEKKDDTDSQSDK